MLRRLVTCAAIATLASALLPLQRHIHGTFSSSALHAAPLSETTVERISTQIRTELQASELNVATADDDPNGSHISIKIVSPVFEGLSRVKRQQAVYRCLKTYMDSGEIHAVDQMVTIAPSEQQ